MTYVVSQHCVDCKYTDCVTVCPVDAFHEGPRTVYINPDTCVNCDACVPACPVEAIYSEENLVTDPSRTDYQTERLSTTVERTYPSSAIVLNLRP